MVLTFTLNTPVTPCNSGYADAWEIIWGGFCPDGSLIFEGDIWLALGQTSGQAKFGTSGWHSRCSQLAFYVGHWAPSYVLDVLPGQPEQPANLGFCKQCQQQAGRPINLTTGNVWIPQSDYSVPGLGGGLELSRVWNSRRVYASPYSQAGMFGFGWTSTYEEELLAVNAQTLQYWRADVSGWTFTYNSALNSYTLTSPPDERAQLVQNPSSGTFTITFADGTQKVFNSNNQLAAILDRNGNQTTLAYDSLNRLITVTSAGGSTLTFNYGNANNPSLVSTVADAVGTVATYAYDSSSDLTQVTYPDGSAYNFTFDANSNIATVTDSHSKLIESHTYDAQNRGLTSARAYGVDSVSLTY